MKNLRGLQDRSLCELKSDDAREKRLHSRWSSLQVSARPGEEALRPPDPGARVATETTEQEAGSEVDFAFLDTPSVGTLCRLGEPPNTTF